MSFTSTKARVIFAALFVDFLALTIWAFNAMHWNLVAMFDAIAASPIGIQVGVDLGVALSLAAVWLWQDARKRGMNPVPFVVAMPFVGALAPLFYLVVRRGEPAAEPVGAVAHGV